MIRVDRNARWRGRVAAFVCILAFGMVPGAIAAPVSTPAPTNDAGASAADAGIRCAFAGDDVQAESAFVSMLSRSRNDAAALNNLANLRLMHGELGVALAFLDRALRGDPSDAGIQLNRATVLMLLHDESRAAEAAAAAIKLPGGRERAAEMMGGPQEKGKALKRTFLTKGEIQDLLRRAVAAVPSDTLSKTRQNGPTRRGRTPWRQGASRGAEGTDAIQILYWKR